MVTLHLVSQPFSQACSSPSAPARRPPAGRQSVAQVVAAACMAIVAVTASAEPLGRDLGGQLVDADAFKGRVLLVFRWSTSCAVCMDKWSELRANARGWTGRPFTLVAVNTDPEAAWRNYEGLVARLQPNPANIVSLRVDADPGTARLPVTEVRDAHGRLVSRIEGRVPPALWDDLADLMP